MKVTEKAISDTVTAYVCENTTGFSVEIWTLGAIIQSIKLPNGGDIVLGYDSVQEYQKHGYFFGTAVGPVANRISGAKFALNGTEYQLEANNGENNLHGGSTGLHTKNFTGKILENSLVLTTVCPHLEGGFPGELSVEISYSLGEDNSLSVNYKASSTEDTIVNLTNHSYFNLDGQEGTCLENVLQVKAENFTFNDSDCIPTGEILPVKATALDFNQSKPIGRDLYQDDINLKNAGGFDHNYIINSEKTMTEFATAQGKLAIMRVSSNCPCVQLYTGNFIEQHKGKNSANYGKHSGFCLETGVYPNAINRSNFPSSVLKKGDIWEYKTVFSFQSL